MEEDRIGGAGNVAQNIDCLGGRGILLGVAGRDNSGAALFRLKGKDNQVVCDERLATLVKTRIIAQRHQIVRVDWEQQLTLPASVERKLLAVIAACPADGIIVSDYAKGSLNEKLMKALKALALRRKIPLLVDPKPGRGALYAGATGITPNLREAEEMLHARLPESADIARAVIRLRRKFRARLAVITCGAEGIVAGEKGRRTFYLPALSREVFDVTGAGDTVVAVLTLALVAGANLREAVALANAAASIVVEKVGTAAVTAEELSGRLKFLLKKH
jgi:D-beta-D-heptose 7-phosphate kinase/D-beta-D-heptose 1-phosphate adenosyltransferase